MTLQAATYVIYLATSLYVTVYVGHILHRDGCPFLDDIFPERKDVGHAINDLLLTGYYLVNFALDVLLLRHPEPMVNVFDALHWYSHTLGIVLVTLGGMHFLNVAVLITIQRSGLLNQVTKQATR